MALGSYIGLHSSEKFNSKSKQLSEFNDFEEMVLEDSNNLLMPKIPLDLRTLPDPSNSAKSIAMKFNKGTTTLSFVYKGGIVVAADSRATGGSYIGTQECKKIIIINKYLLGTMAGGAADCSYWHRVLSRECRLFELRNKQRITVAAASKILSNILYGYKGYGLSLGVMVAGWDNVRGPQIFYVDNDGSRFLGNLFSVGSGSIYAYGVLDTFYRYDMTDEEAFDLGRRAIFHATHRDAMSGGIVRVYSIKEDGWHRISETDMDELYDAYGMKRD